MHFCTVLILSAVLLLGGTLQTVKHPYTRGGFEAGMVVLLYDRHFKDQKDLENKLTVLFDELIELNVNAVSLAWPIYVDGIYGSNVFEGEETPSLDTISLFIKRAKERQFIVSLRPIIDEHSIMASGEHEWRGTIRPKNVQRWFSNYTQLLLKYARVGESSGANSLVVATELTSMEAHKKAWRALTKAVREEFSNSLVYSSNQGISEQFPWEAVDVIGVDAFFELTTPLDPTVADMVESWERWVAPLLKRKTELKMPLVFTEIGSASQKGAHRQSWVWNHRTPVDLEDQRQFYLSACTVWKEKLDGLYWWTATIEPLTDPQSDRSFTPLQKPAEAEIKKCFGK